MRTPPLLAYLVSGRDSVTDEPVRDTVLAFAEVSPRLAPRGARGSLAQTVVAHHRRSTSMGTSSLRAVSLQHRLAASSHRFEDWCLLENLPCATRVPHAATRAAVWADQSDKRRDTTCPNLRKSDT